MWHELNFRSGRVATAMLAITLLAAASSAIAQSASPGAPGTYQHMDYGSVISQTIAAPWPEANTAYKGLAIRLEHDAAVVFDTDLLRYAAGTVGGWVNILDTDLAAPKGHKTASTEGDLVFATAARPGWAHPESGTFDDTRPDQLGNLPRDHAHYRGRYRNGDRVILSYSVGEADVLEMPQAVRVAEDRVAFVRHMQIANATTEHRALLARAAEEETIEVVEDRVMLIRGDDRTLTVLLNVERDGQARLAESSDGRSVILHVSSGDSEAVRLEVAIVELAADAPPATASALASNLPGKRPDLEALTRGGPAQWNEPIVTTGELGADDWAYTVDTITLPMQNPWNARFRVMGFDFFEGGDRAAVATLNGDVWIVEGLDDTLEELRWRRFASGMFYPGGLRIVDDSIYVLERCQLTRLHDLNDDGEADFYENFNNDHHVHPMAHALTLEIDPAGNFYFFKNGNRVPAGVPNHGRLIRVSADGKTREIYAHGFRGSNGLHITDDGVILASDQQGDWVPATRIDMVQQDGFYGHRPHGGQGKEIGEYELPICWIPHSVDNSSGDAALAPGDGRFGPLAGQWVHTSYGQAALFVLMFEEIDGVRQGGVVRLPLRFESGIMRARFNDRDGQLYLTGMRGWQTVSFLDGAFYRVRCTGKPANLPIDIRVWGNTVALTFTDPLDVSVATDIDRYTAGRWTYIYTSAYGSPEVSLETPADLRAPAARRPEGVVEGRDDVSITGVSLSDDARTVTLEFDELRPVKQMMIEYDLRGEDGSDLTNAVYHTIHTLGDGAQPDR